MSSSEINIFQDLLEYIRKHPEYRNELFEILYPGEYVKRDEMTQILEELKQQRKENNSRFEEQIQELRTLREDTNKRFEQVDKRFEQVDKRFEQVDKRFEQVDKRFVQVDKRFDMMQNQIDMRFDKVFERFDELSYSLGHDFEEFNSSWVQDYLRVQGYPKLQIHKKTFIDEDYSVFADSKEVEIDIFNETPLIIGEVTAIVREIKKISLFLRKVKFLEKKFGSPHSVFFITYAIVPKIKDEALKLLNQNEIKIFMLRQKEMDNS